MGDETYNWDAQLLSVDWRNVDWRMEVHNFQRVPWPEVQTTTLQRLVEMHNEYDQNHRPSSSWPINTPASDELRRRENLEMHNQGTESQSVADWLFEGSDMDMDTAVSPGREPPAISAAPYGGAFFFPKSSPDEPPKRLEPIKTPVNTVDQHGQRKLPGLIYKDDPDGFWTVGFELELPIAVYRRGGLPAERPHPRDTRWEAEEIVSDDLDPKRIKQIVVDRFIEVFSTQTDMVFVPRDEDEGNALHDLRMENLHRLEYGMPMVQDIEMNGSPLGADEIKPVHPIAEKAAVEARDFLLLSYYNNASPPQNLLLATRLNILDAVQRSPMPGIPSNPLRREAERRLEDLLHLEAYRLRRDKRHVPLAGMKPRYRAFSVYTTDVVNMDLVEGSHYREVPTGTENPSELYGWQTVKIASPVMRLTWPPTELGDTIREICRVVRNNFRVHLETPAIAATTQVSISHTSGLNVIDLKKLASLLGADAVHKDLRRFNRWYRHLAAYDNVCGPIRMVSKLGKLAQTNHDIDGFDSSDIVQRHGPLRTEHLNRVAESYLPVNLMLQHENFAGRVFHQVMWQYTSVDGIANALGTGHTTRKGEVVIKCRGPGEVVSRAPPDPEDEFRRSERGEYVDFYEVDKDRGVVEFRQMGLSLDPRHITAWILVCWRIMEFVRTSQPPQYRFALEQVIRDKVSVLKAISLDPEVRQYINELISHPGQGLHSDNRIIDWRDPFFPRLP
ncbi:uncharacterized protein F4812DRAFT_465801 [Daldinia caldariorum]|uniref:uncharacterized protein n=1 Tax=Daldinia caldariorum TaxID=326644 RepID=UPI0020074F66|nr:uncharacterized protein F4812DRAFT_465801 [Daldinia caldariorum]KAI1466572.1 hypothetical protein F4812DRAFT_465801 [Daldinia caldariorum]